MGKGGFSMMVPPTPFAYQPAQPPVVTRNKDAPREWVIRVLQAANGFIVEVDSSTWGDPVRSVQGAATVGGAVAAAMNDLKDK